MADRENRMEVAANALEVEALSHSFGRRKALDDVGLVIPAGGFTVLLGQNGAGKTTLFNLITRLYSNRAGHIRIFGTDVRAHPRSALARLGVVFQQRTIDLDLSIRQNLIYHAGLHGMPRAEARRRTEEELARFELAGRGQDLVRTLSGGQVRRVEIARALLHRPRLLLLDEPTVGLDIGSRQGILEHVRRMCAEEGIGVLWATHLID
jgi:ABC-2 type transport system ATP-binding protein